MRADFLGQRNDNNVENGSRRSFLTRGLGRLQNLQFGVQYERFPIHRRRLGSRVRLLVQSEQLGKVSAPPAETGPSRLLPHLVGPILFLGVGIFRAVDCWLHC